ncbi:MAG: M23 family metallopeptidase [Bacteroidota bacterium]
MNKKIFLTLCLPIFMGRAAFAQPYKTNLDIRIPFLSQPVMIDGKPTLYYELNITNFGSDTIRLKTLRISDPVDNTTLALFDNAALKTRFNRVGPPVKDNSPNLPGGSTGILYMDLVVKKGRPLAHQFKFETSGHVDSTDSVTIGQVNLLPAPPLILAAPLGNGKWAAIYDPVWRNGHRRVIYTVNGHAGIPGRYAIDFMQLDNQGKLSNGNDDVVKEWYGYGADVLAVADGVIASQRDDFPETSTVSGRERVKPERATGNYISLKIGEGKYVFYEHLKPGSIRVKQGQKVKKGQVIASLGFTGQSEGPHLHFHVANTNSPLGAEGLPFSFEHFTYLGKYTEIDKLGKSPWAPAAPSDDKQRFKERPSPNSVISFSSRQ